jgi:hypothetical protein
MEKPSNSECYTPPYEPLGSSTSHNTKGLHGLLQEQLWCQDYTIWRGTVVGTTEPIRVSLYWLRLRRCIHWDCDTESGTPVSETVAGPAYCGKTNTGTQHKLVSAYFQFNVCTSIYGEGVWAPATCVGGDIAPNRINIGSSEPRKRWRWAHALPA